LGFFPLDEQLGLRPNHAYTPRLAESMTRLATWMPFQRAATELAFFSGVPVAEATVRRITQAAGAAYVAVQEAVVEALEREAPEGQPGPALQLLSVDGAFIQLINREWKEVKTLALGEVQPPVLEQGKPVVHTRALSSFSRCSASETFVRQALVETHRRGVTEAGVVCAVTDGSVWIQGFIDYHRPDAVRILDQPHALEYVATIGKALYGDDTSAFTAWYARQQQRLSTEAPEGVLAAGGGWAGTVRGRRGQPDIFDETVSAGAVRGVPGARLSNWRGQCREREQAGGGSAAQGHGDALGGRSCGQDVGAAQHRVQ
jgi:hypothetical protein